jgi:hypothetical protein
MKNSPTAQLTINLRRGGIAKMKGSKHPIRNTIFYGLVCGLAFMPVALTLNTLIPWSRAVGLTLWVFIAGYALLLNSGGKKFQISTVFPLLLLLAVIFLTRSMVLFFISALIVSSWIRSGICYPKSGVKVLAVELMLCLIGAVLLQLVTPGSVFAWAFGVWLFFLVQALYFVFFEHTDKRQEESARMDAFERASRLADRILTDAYLH